MPDPLGSTPTSGSPPADLAPQAERPASRIPIGDGAPWPSVSRVGCTHIWGITEAQIGAELEEIVIDAVEVSFEFDPRRHGDVQVLVKTPEGIWADVPGQTSPAPGASTGRLAWKGSTTALVAGPDTRHAPPYPHGTWHVKLADNDDCTDLTGVGLRLIGSGVR